MAEAAPAGAIRTVTDGPVLEVVIDRPKANAIDAATSRELSRVFAAFRDDPDLRVAILTGAGDRFFSAGWDLNAAAEGEDYEADYGEGGFGGFGELPGLLKPVIAAVNGMAVGGGFEIVLAADLVVATDHARFWLPEASLGLMPDSGSVRLPRMLPPAVANEVLYAGRRLNAADALRWGLVNSGGRPGGPDGRGPRPGGPGWWRPPRCRWPPSARSATARSTSRGGRRSNCCVPAS